MFLKYLHVNKEFRLNLSEVEKPIINPDECLVKVRSIGVNRADLLQKAGKYPPPKGESDILGLEVSGEVVECGTLCKNWKIGQKVFGLVAGGAYAEYVVIKQGQMFTLPTNFTFEQGAATAEVFLTAYQSLFQIGQLKQNASVLIHAGASGVGTAAIQLAKAMNCFVVATVSNDHKAQACLALGADKVINYHESDFENWTRENHASGYDVIVDVVAGSHVNKDISVAKMDCHIIVLSMLGGRYSDPIDFAKMLSKRITISASTLRNRSNDYKNNLVAHFKDEFEALFIKGTLSPVIHETYHWEDVNQAHEVMANNKNIGKIVLSVY